MSAASPTFDEQIGAILRKRRERAQLTQGALGRIVGLHQSGIGQIERGERKLPASDLGAYAEALGVPVVRLLPVKWRGK